MIVCDLCGQSNECSKRQIDDKEYDICPDCWNALTEKLKGKGTPVRKRDVVLLPSTPPSNPAEPEPASPPQSPPKIWARCVTRLGMV
jgi:ribosome-binding protein aMBF1 (putative translation factor)